MIKFRPPTVYIAQRGALQKNLRPPQKKSARHEHFCRFFAPVQMKGKKAIGQGGKETNMKSEILISISALPLLATLAIPLRVAAQGQEDSSQCRHQSKLIEFDAPDAGKGPGSPLCYLACPGTLAYNNNPQGTVTGYYVDLNNLVHGFLRARDGTITQFDAPGAGTVTGSFQGTLGYSINPGGTIAGQYQDETELYHGFLRSSGSTFTTIDAPGAGTEANQGTIAQTINPGGTVAGYYFDVGNLLHGFVRSRDGTITGFEAPGAVNGTFVAGPSGNALNPQGDVTGWYFDASSVVHGYLRHPDGAIKKIDVKGAGNTSVGQGTYSASINPEGVIVGFYVDDNNTAHGFLRARDGAVTEFDVTGAGTGSFDGTFAAAINPAGTIAGYTVDNNNVAHGFLRGRDGTITVFDAPDAGTGSGQGTVGFGINAAGEIAGFYTDSNNVNHGLVLIP
jgi:hypothetical protein